MEIKSKTTINFDVSDVLVEGESKFKKPHEMEVKLNWLGNLIGKINGKTRGCEPVLVTDLEEGRWNYTLPSWIRPIYIKEITIKPTENQQEELSKSDD